MVLSNAAFNSAIYFSNIMQITRERGKSASLVLQREQNLPVNTPEAY